VAQARKDSTTSGHIIDAGTINCASESKVQVKPLLAEGGTDRATVKAKLKQHLEKAQDATDFLDYLDQIEQQTQSESSEVVPPSNPATPLSPLAPAAPPPPSDLFRTGQPGRPNYSVFILEEAKYRIRAGEIIPTPRGLAKFARDLWNWWEDVRVALNAQPITPLTIENCVREIWNAALPTNPIK
jgi:hypothetical protein